MKPPRPALGSATHGFRRFKQRPDISRRLAWGIVAGSAIALGVIFFITSRDTASRREAAGDALRWEQGRVDAENEARYRARFSRVMAAEQARQDDRMQDDREKLREQEGLRRSRKELEDATFELQQAQDRASR